MEAAAAATVAEKDKQQRYPPAGGRVVRTFAMETWGRLGNEAEETLSGRGFSPCQKSRACCHCRLLLTQMASLA